MGWALSLGLLCRSVLGVAPELPDRPVLAAYIERDDTLLGLTDRDPSADGCLARVRLFEAAFGRHDAYGVTMAAGGRLPRPWLDAMAAAGREPVVTLEWSEGVDIGQSVRELALALGDLDRRSWVRLFPSRTIGEAKSRRDEVSAAGVLLKAIAPRCIVVRPMDSRGLDAAAEWWDDSRTYDCRGIDFVVGHRACCERRDLQSELRNAAAVGRDAGPLVVGRLAVSHQCHACQVRYPEEAGRTLGEAFANLTAAGHLALIAVDSSDSTAGGHEFLDFGLCASDGLARAYRCSLQSAGLSQGGPAVLEPSADAVTDVGRDLSVLWLVAIAVSGVLLTIGAIGAAGRLQRHGNYAVSGRRWAPVGLLLLVTGCGIIALPALTSVLAVDDRRAAAADTARGSWLVLPGSSSESAPSPAHYDLVIPDIGLAEPVHEDATVENLKRGLCHYAGTARPGEPSNCSIAGHRSTYGAPFRRLVELRQGSEIAIVGQGFRRTYRVAWLREVDPLDGRLLGPTKTEALTLSTCHPFGLATKRLIVRAYPGAVGVAAARARPLDERWPAPPVRLLTANGLTERSDGSWVPCDASAYRRHPPVSSTVWAAKAEGALSAPLPSFDWGPPTLVGPSLAADGRTHR